MVKYLQISADLRVDGDQYFGPIVASADAIYVMPDRKATMLGGQGGLLVRSLKSG